MVKKLKRKKEKEKLKVLLEGPGYKVAATKKQFMELTRTLFEIAQETEVPVEEVWELYLKECVHPEIEEAGYSLPPGGKWPGVLDRGGVRECFLNGEKVFEMTEAERIELRDSLAKIDPSAIAQCAEILKAEHGNDPAANAQIDREIERLSQALDTAKTFAGDKPGSGELVN